jgi:phosphoribosylanthranilate isomerase
VIVKICGITNVEDARHALDAGADWIGLNFVSGPRKIDVATAKTILVQLDQPARAVALVAMEDGSADPQLLNVLRSRGVARLQLYGDVPAATVAQLHTERFETIVVRVIHNAASLDLLDSFLKTCGSRRPDYVLLDAPMAGRQGGTGRRFDWPMLAVAHERGRYAAWPPILLAGGLTPDNVAEAIRILHPSGVDVSSGIESQPGKKDPAKVQAFIQAARAPVLTKK